MEERHENRIRRPQGKVLLGGGSRSQRPRNAAKLALLIGILLLALAGCGPPPDSVAEQLIEAVNTQDLDGALRLFAIDAVVDTGTEAPFAGKDEIRRWLERLFFDNIELEQGETLAGPENGFQARYKVTADSASALGVAYLEGVGEMKVQEGRITALSFGLSEGSRADLSRAGAPVLSYVVLPDPDPLRASPGEGYEPNLASLTVVVTNNSAQKVLVRSIKFRLPVGSSAGDLALNLSGVNSEAPRYWYRTKPKTPVHWHLTPVEGLFMLEPELPQDGVLGAGDALSFRLSEIEVSDKPGVWNLEIVEETGEDTQGSTTIQLAKFPFEP